MKRIATAALIGSLFASYANAEPNYATPIRNSAQKHVANYERDNLHSFYSGDKSPGLGSAYWMVSGAALASSVADVEATMRNKARCETYMNDYLSAHPDAAVSKPCSDVYFLTKPFVKIGRPAAHAAIDGLTVGALGYAAYQKKKGSRIWWIWPAVAIGAHTYGIINNSKGFKFEVTVTK